MPGTCVALHTPQSVLASFSMSPRTPSLLVSFPGNCCYVKSRQSHGPCQRKALGPGLRPRIRRDDTSFRHTSARQYPGLTLARYLVRSLPSCAGPEHSRDRSSATKHPPPDRQVGGNYRGEDFRGPRPSRDRRSGCGNLRPSCGACGPDRTATGGRGWSPRRECLAPGSGEAEVDRRHPAHQPALILH